MTRGIGDPDPGELIALSEDQIDYDSLSDEALNSLSLSPELYIATTAMTELGRRKSVLAAQTAQAVLCSAMADKFLKAAALRVLADSRAPSALTYMQSNVMSCDPYILNEIIEILISEDDDAVRFAPLVPQVRNRLLQISPDQEYPRQDVRELFSERYGEAPRRS